MSYVVTEACIKCKYTDCVDVCPTDAFREAPNMLVIDTEDCIGCNLCVSECPAEAIFSIYDLPENQKNFIKINEILSKTSNRIISRKKPPEDAADWLNVPDKLHLIEGIDETTLAELILRIDSNEVPKKES